MEEDMEKQELRNALCAIEDEARHLRNNSNIHDTREPKILNLIVQLAQIVRQEIVK